MTYQEDLGAMDRTTASTYCGQKFGTASPNFAPCVDHYALGRPGDYVPAAQPSTSSTIGGIFGSILGGLAASKYQQPGMMMPPPYNPTPSWVMPVAIGGIAIVAVMLLRRPRSNPARRRRARRRSRR